MVRAAAGLAHLARAGTIVIPGWPVRDTPPPRLVAALRRAHDRGARLVSVCSGVFVLAATGLLDGRRATTHWRYIDALQSRYPRIEVEPDVLYVDEGSILTSAGSAAGIDLCLHIVRRDFGAGDREPRGAPSARAAGARRRPGAVCGAADAARRGAGARARPRLGERASRAAASGRSARRARRHVAAQLRAAIQGGDRHDAPPLARAPARARRAASARADRTVDRSRRRISGPADRGHAAQHFRRTLKTTPSAYRHAFSVRARPASAAAASPSGSSPRR